MASSSTYGAASDARDPVAPEAAAADDTDVYDASYDKEAHLPLVAKYDSSAVVLARLVACVASVADGFDLGSFSTVTEVLVEQFGLSSWGLGLLASGPSLIYCMAAVCAFTFSDFIGRKRTIAGVCVALIIGTTIQALASSIWMFAVGRCIVNAAGGVGTATVTVYMTEVTPAANRGLMVSCEELLMNVGIGMAYFAGLWSHSSPDSWRYIIGVGVFIPALAFGLTFMPQVPESPRFLLLNGKNAEAEATLRRLVHDPVELTEALRAWEHEKSMRATLPLVESIRQTPRALWVAAVGVACAVNLSGVHPIHGLLNSVLTNVAGKEAAPGWGFGIMVAKVAVLVPACLYFVDNTGRRPLLMISAMCMSAGAALTAVALATGMPGSVAALGVAIHLVCFSLGAGPAMWPYMAEVLPTEVRAFGVGLAIFLARLLTATQLFFLAPAMEASPSHLFAFYVVTNIIAIAFFYSFCPETKGITLESVRQASFVGSVSS